MCVKRATLIAVGSELVEGVTLNTNSAYLSKRLAEVGYRVSRVLEVDDDLDLIRDEVKRALEDSHLVVTTGGLGPTEDDLTREAVAEALGKKLIYDEKLYRKIERKLEAFLNRIPRSIRKEAMVLEGAEILENDVGSAPGQILKVEDKTVILLPGPPSEMRAVFERALERMEKYQGWIVKTLKFYGVRESTLESDLEDVIYSQKDVEVATQADFVKGVMLRFKTTWEHSEDLQRIIDLIKKGPYSRDLYAEDDETMEERVVRMLEERNTTLAVAESCSGGMLSSTLVNVPGVSRVFKGGIIAYDNSVKEKVLGVESEILKRFGAVSGECVRAMSEGVKDILRADVSIAISGIAGPEGGSEEKPVGLVFIDLYDGSEHNTGEFEFGYDRSRNTIRMKSVMTALDMLRRKLLDWRDVS